MKTKSLRITQFDFSCIVEHIGEISIVEYGENLYRLVITRNTTTDDVFWSWLQDQQDTNLDGSYNARGGFYNRVIVMFPVRRNREGKSTMAMRVVANAFQYLTELYQTYIKECCDEI